MAKTAKILEIKSIRPYTTSEWKQLYAHLIIMDNGDEWECSKVKENWLSIWEELQYELIPWTGNYANKIKLLKKELKTNGKSYQQEDPQVRFIGFAISYAKDIAVANITKWFITESEKILDHADLFLKWMNDEYLKIKPKQPTENTQNEQKNNSDLISSSQITLVKTLRWKTWLTEEDIRKYMKDNYNVWSTKELTKEQASLFIDYMQALVKFQEQSGSKKDEFPF